jgi:transposase
MMNTETRKRLGWVQLYEETNDAGYVCRRCGISRPTLRKWLKRYKEVGLDGLKGQRKKPEHSPNQKIFENQEEWILTLRDEMNIGARRIQNELVRLSSIFSQHPKGLATKPSKTNPKTSPRKETETVSKGNSWGTCSNGHL